MITLDPSALGRLERAAQVAPAALLDEIGVWMRTATAHMTAEVQDRTPTAHGLLRQSIHGEATRLGSTWLGVTASSAAHAVPVELGTRPHWAPLQPLIAWVETKLGLTGPAGAAVARAVRWGISRHGTEGAQMFSKAFSANRGLLASTLSAAIDRALARAGSTQ